MVFLRVSFAVNIEIFAIAIGAVRIIREQVLKWLALPHHEWLVSVNLKQMTPVRFWHFAA